MARSKDSYLRKREAIKRRSRERVESVADIGEIPAVADAARREACRTDLARFLVTYFPQSTGRKPFSADHLKAIGRIQRCVLEGGLFLNLFPRGFGKTTISENAAIWAVVYGHRRFVAVFGADANAAGGNVDSVKLELAENDLLYADFPEVCHAVRALEGKPQRCASQTCTQARPCPDCGGTGRVPNLRRPKPCERCGGSGSLSEPRLTHIEWTADQIVLPTIEGSAASGAILTARGLMGGSRGMKHKRPDGTQQRPDLVILDDPQTDESASTPLQVAKRLNVIRKSILKLGGHDRQIAAVMNATVIRPDDMVEQILDPKKFPAWQGERIKMVRKWADAHETLWMGDYARLRNTYDAELLGDQQRAHREATEFYRRNREKMDAGAEVAWEHCFDPASELSAVQHAYNILIDDGEEVFASECQNEPLKEKAEGELETVSPDAIAARLNRLPRYALPAEANRLVAFIDVHDNVLYYEVAALGEGFTGAVVDYGTWPEQGQMFFAQRNVRVTIARKTGKAQFEEQLYAALDALANLIMGREWKREDGALLKPERIPIDARDGDHAETVKLFCRRSPHAAVLLPSNGIYVGAKSRQGFNDRPAQTGERRGWNWRIEPKPGSRGVLKFDTNAWKTRAASFWRVPMGGKGCITLFGDTPDRHRMYAAHQAAEYPVRVTVNGRTVSEWQARPNEDNHLEDCHVGCLVAASTLGVDVAGPAAAVKRKRVKLSEMQKKAKVWKANNNG